MPADLLIYGLVAAGLVFWLRSILGTRSGNERERPNPFTREAQGQGTTAKPSPVAPSPAAAGLSEAAAPEARPSLERNMAIAPAAAEGLDSIARIDRSFDPGDFLRGAQDAFVMIVEAFAAADRETLKNLTTESVYSAFDSALKAREAQGQKGEVEIHAIRRAEIIKAWLERKTAFITVRFVADETNVLRDKDGLVLQGDPERVSETIDVWTFMRDLRSREPGWYLAETRDGDAESSDHKTVPNS